MFMFEYFRKQKKRNAEQEEELEEKQRFWEFSKKLYKAVVETAMKLEDNLPYEYEGGSGSVIATLSYMVDERLSMAVQLTLPKRFKKLIGYEARFYIDGKRVDYNFEDYNKLASIVAHDLQMKIKMYNEMKNTAVADYLEWKNKHVDEPVNKRCPVCNGNSYQETKEEATAK